MLQMESMNLTGVFHLYRYISRFRSPERLSSESGYYLSSLVSWRECFTFASISATDEIIFPKMGAIAFIETMDYTSLSNITQEEFER